MTTAKQVAANRENAKQSTGPATDEGRERAKMNALKHGLTAETVIISAERAEDYEAFQRAMFEECAPVGALECELVGRAIFCGWRLRRAAALEASLERGTRARAKRSRDDRVKFDPEVFRQFPGMLADPNEEWNGFSQDQINLLRYETTMERGFYRAIHNLERVQARRLGQHVAAPIAIDIGHDANTETTLKSEESRQK